ncbi:hypothetical protein Q1695_015932 [Nippostrongylus brasiliensis]|nr:hypothetical protein Q1695_015932 [Nippostrongylus brasiliensis]
MVYSPSPIILLASHELLPSPMISLALLFSNLLVVESVVWRGDPPPFCRHLSEYFVARWQVYNWAEQHKGLNLTFDCEVLKLAQWEVELMMQGQPYGLRKEYCQYSRLTYDFLDLRSIFTGNFFYRMMPWEKMRQTAKLHAGTKYACAFKMKIPAFNAFWATVCLYKRLPGDDRCFCN